MMHTSVLIKLTSQQKPPFTSEVPPSHQSPLFTKVTSCHIRSPPSRQRPHPSHQGPLFTLEAPHNIRVTTMHGIPSHPYAPITSGSPPITSELPHHIRIPLSHQGSPSQRAPQSYSLPIKEPSLTEPLVKVSPIFRAPQSGRRWKRSGGGRHPSFLECWGQHCMTLALDRIMCCHGAGEPAALTMAMNDARCPDPRPS